MGLSKSTRGHSFVEYWPRRHFWKYWNTFEDNHLQRAHVDANGGDGGTGGPRMNHRRIRMNLKVIGDDDDHNVSVAGLRKRVWYRQSTTKGLFAVNSTIGCNHHTSIARRKSETM
jgi:hypothetical protein